MNGFIVFASIIGIITTAIILAHYVITPLLLYLLDTIAFIVGKILTRLSPRNTNSPESPNQSTIQSKYGVYNPNPIQYLFRLHPTVKGKRSIKESHFVQSSEKCNDCPFFKNAFDKLDDSLTFTREGDLRCLLRIKLNSSDALYLIKKLLSF